MTLFLFAALFIFTILALTFLARATRFRWLPQLGAAVIVFFAMAAYAATPSSSSSGAPIDAFFDFLVKSAPLFAALGLYGVFAKAIGAAWDKAGIFVGSTPNKVDDFAYHLLDPAMQELKRVVSSGDVKAAHDKIDAVVALAKSIKS